MAVFSLDFNPQLLYCNSNALPIAAPVVGIKLKTHDTQPFKTPNNVKSISTLDSKCTSLTTSFLSAMSQSFRSRMQRSVASGSSNSQKPKAVPQRNHDSINSRLKHTFNCHFYQLLPDKTSLSDLVS